MSKVYIFMADGFEEIEGLTVVDMMRREKIDIFMVSMNDTPQVTGSHGITIKTDGTMADVCYEEGAMFVLPGGMPGTNHLAASQALGKLLTRAAADGKYVAAICAAPSVLGGLGLLAGKNATSYPGFEDKLTGASCKTDNVVIDGNIITSRGMGTAIEFSAALVALLTDAGTAQALKASIMYPY